MTIEQMVRAMRHVPSLPLRTHEAGFAETSLGWIAPGDGSASCAFFWNEVGDIGLLFLGEHYAGPDENVQLRSAGHQFNEDDASCLVHLYEEHGTNFFQVLNGTFSGVLVDRRENKVVLFNDRYGLGRVYYHENADGFYFASEAKAILRVLPALRALDPRGLGELLACGCTLQNRTLFPGIFLLPPGSAWAFRPGQAICRERYFDRTAWEAQTRLSPDTYYGALKETFNRVLPNYFHGRPRVALSITGGLDSRMIIAGAQAAPGELPCYTFGGTYRDSEDVKVGRLVANLCGQPHSVIRADEDFFPNFLDLAKQCVYITDGTMDVSGAVGLYVNRKARDLAPVRMTGNYGSEILRENVAFKAETVPPGPFSRDFARFLNGAVDTYAVEKQSCARLSFIAFKQVPWHHYARFAEEQSQLTVRSPYLDNDLVRLAYQAPTDLLLKKQLAYRYTTDTQPALAGVPTDRGLLNRPRMVPRPLFSLWKEWRPKAEYYYDYGMPQWLAEADRLLSPLHLEKMFLGQQKYYHFRTWYRRPLADAVKQILLDPQALNRPFLNRRQVEAVVNAHLRGTGNHTIAIHQLMTCEFIQRLLIEEPRP